MKDQDWIIKVHFVTIHSGHHDNCSKDFNNFQWKMQGEQTISLTPLTIVQLPIKMPRKQKLSLTPLTSPPPFFSPVAASSSLTDLWYGRFDELSLIYIWNFWISMSQVQARQDCKRTLLTCKAWPCFTMRSLQVWRFSNLAAIPLIALTLKFTGHEKEQ